MLVVKVINQICVSATQQQREVGEWLSKTTSLISNCQIFILLPIILNSNCETMKNHACLDTAWYMNSRLLVWYVRKVFMMRGLLMRKNVASNAWQISFNSYSKSASNVINHDTRPLRITFFSELNWEGKRVGSVARRFLAWRMSLCVSLHNGS